MESLVVAVGILGLAILFAYLIVRLLRLFYTPTQPAKLSEVLDVPGGSKITFERYGRTFVARVVLGGKSRPNRVRLLTKPDKSSDLRQLNNEPDIARGSVEIQPRLVLRAETDTDRWGKTKGLNNEIQIGDADFDKKIYIESDSDPALVQRLLANPELRERIVNLLWSGINELVLNRSGLQIECKFESVEADGPLIRNVLPKLADVANLLPVFTSNKIAKSLHYYFEWIAGAVATAIFLFLLDARIFRPFQDRPVMLLAAGVGLALAAALTYVAIKTVGGTSVSFRRISSIAIFAFILCPFGSYWVICYFNYAYDQSASTMQRSTVTKAWTTQSKGNTYYHIEVAPWRSGDNAVQLYVSESFAKFADNGKTIEVYTHPGKLGFEWIERYRIPSK
jgi:hypothetical protein